jgi:patatin-like phospholipase/acyl hydrolase
MKCLCMDGGGIRGIATVSFLKQLVQDRLKVDPTFNLYDAFDLFGGTSAGSFIAICIGSMRMNIFEINDLFCSDLARNVFSTPSFSGKLLTPKYTNENLELMLQNSFGTTSFTSSLKTIIVPAYSLTQRDLIIFDSSDDKYNDVTCIEAALASSAAPCFFPSVKVQSDWFIDGGIIANNPSLITLGICTKKKIQDVQILSIGTGRYIPQLDGKETSKWGAIQWGMNGIFHIIHDGEQVANVAKMIMGEDYLRINSTMSEKVSLTDNSSVLNCAQLVKIGISWYWENKEEIWKWFDWDLV